MVHLPAPDTRALDADARHPCPQGDSGSAHAVELRLLGPLTVRRHGVTLALPASRKMRALLAYLALAPQSVSRSQLCDLFWDVPNDPRGELRWCLSKIRSIVDEPGQLRLDARADAVRFDRSDCFVDAAEVARAAQEGFGTLSPERLRALAALFVGDFLDGLDVHRSPAFDGWLTAQRRRFRAWHVALLERLAGSAGEGDGLEHLERWLELAPYDLRVHERLLEALARRGQVREAEEHLAATLRLFEAEDLETGPVHAAWRSARARAGTALGVPSGIRTSGSQVSLAAGGVPDGARPDDGPVVPGMRGILCSRVR